RSRTGVISGCRRNRVPVAYDEPVPAVVRVPMCRTAGLGGSEHRSFDSTCGVARALDQSNPLTRCVWRRRRAQRASNPTLLRYANERVAQAVHLLDSPPAPEDTL